MAALSTRSLELARATVVGRSTVEKSFCEYTPATAKLPDFETNRIRLERMSTTTALVSASYTYDRFFLDFSAAVAVVTPTRLRWKTAHGVSI